MEFVWNFRLGLLGQKKYNVRKIMMEFTDCNKLMINSLKKLNKLKNNTYQVDLKDIIKLMQTGFVNADGCILHDHNKLLVLNFWKQSGSKSKFENFENHIHMSDFVMNETGLILLEFGIAVCHVLSLKLKNSYPKYNFRITVSYDVKNEYGYNDCVVRFHKLRKRESNIAENLEDYKFVAIGYFDI